jgi:hypothetical protein
MTIIPDFTDNELWIIRTALQERYGKAVEPELVEVELRLDPFSSRMTPCPAVFWSELGANFVIAKAGEQRYKPQFFYRVHQQYGTGVEYYTDLTQCVVTLLQVQADHAAKEAANSGN